MIQSLSYGIVKFKCPHCGYGFTAYPVGTMCKWCHGMFPVKQKVLPPRKEVTC